MALKQISLFYLIVHKHYAKNNKINQKIMKTTKKLNHLIFG